jgi:predicted nucleic-acid-binding Zn-ribbon protein
MSSLTAVEKRRFEQFLGMASGYVLDFSNHSFQEFTRDSCGRDIYDELYNQGSGSKANRLRAF